MRAWPFLKLAIPLGTLAALAIGYGIQRLTRAPDPPLNIQRPPPTTFRKLEPPVHGHALAGKVSAPTGEGLERALVWLRSGDEPSFTWTDAKGEFRFDDLGPGPWPAKVVALGHEPLDLVLPESPTPAAIALQKAYGPPPKLAPLERAPLTGRIALPQGFDAKGYQLVLQPDAPTSIDSALPRRVECDAQGAFALDDLIVARYELRVLPAWARGGSWPDLLDPAEHEFTHRAGANELVLHLAFGTLAGTLLDAGGVPVEGALVELALAADSGRLWIPEATDAAGKFVLGPLPRGRYALTIHAGAVTLPQEIELGAGERKQLELKLPPP
jgi:hypothetical protein